MFEVMPVEPTPDQNPEYPVAKYASKQRSPCEVFSCANAERCKTEQLACRSFAKFVTQQQTKKHMEPGEPTKEIFDQIYGDADA